MRSRSKLTAGVAITWLQLWCVVAIAEEGNEWKWTEQRVSAAVDAQRELEERLIEHDEDREIKRLVRPYLRAIQRNSPKGSAREAAFILSRSIYDTIDQVRAPLFDALVKERHEATRNAIALCLLNEYANGEIADASRRRWLQVLRDPSPRVALIAVMVLDDWDDERDDESPEMKKLLADPSARVRGLAALAFDVESEDRRALAPLILKALKQERRDGEPYNERISQWNAYLEPRSAFLHYFGEVAPDVSTAVPTILAYVPEAAEGPRELRRKMDAVASALLALGKPAIPELVKACRSDDFEVRRVAAIVLSAHRSHAEVVLPILIASLDKDCDGVCYAAHFVRYDEDAIAAYGAATVPHLLEYGKDEASRKQIARILAFMPSREAQQIVDALATGLADQREAVRRSAAVALAGRETARVRRALFGSFADELRSVGEAVRNFVMRIKPTAKQQHP